MTRAEESADFSDDNLAQFDVVVWLCASEDVLDEAGQEALERDIHAIASRSEPPECASSDQRHIS